ncbi:hypothetical protein TYRP_022911 [Tyrophagus putrescentiae]|nr:hypothetical protein TYRP_022911 [Tyrophagus putrescentiae]
MEREKEKERTFASTMADQAFRKSHLLMLSGTEEDGQQTELDWEGHNFEKLDRSQINAMAGPFPVENFIDRVETFFNQSDILSAPHLIVVGDIDNNPDSTLNDNEVDQDKLQQLEVFFAENNLVDKIPEDGRPAFSNIDVYHSGIVYARTRGIVNVHVYPMRTPLQMPLLCTQDPPEAPSSPTDHQDHHHLEGLPKRRRRRKSKPTKALATTEQQGTATATTTFRHRSLSLTL